MKKIIFVLALLVVTRLSTAAMTITLSPAAGAPGLKVKVTGSGFAASAVLQIAFDATSIGQVTANHNGSFNARVTAPSPATTGDHVIVATDASSGLAANETFTIQTDWAMFGRDAGRTSYNPVESELGASILPELVTRATFSLDGQQAVGSAAVAGGTIYVADTGGVVHAFLPDGTERWRVTLGGPVLSSPAVGGQANSAGPVVFVGSDDGKVTALSSSDGATLWTFATGGAVRSSPLVTQDVLSGAPCGLFVGSDDGNLYALNCTSGQKVWSFPTGGAVESSPAVLMGVSLPGRTRANVLTFQSSDGNAYGLNAATGALVWSYPTGGGVGSPAMAKVTGASSCIRGCSRAFLGSTSGTVFGLDAGTGAPAWTYDTGSAITGSPAIAPFNLPGVCLACTAAYIGNQAGSFFAFDATNGNLLWRTELGGPVISSPTVANGIIWVHRGPSATGGDGALIALDGATGGDLKDVPLDDANDSAPVITDQTIQLATQSFAPISFISWWPMFRHDPANTGYNDKEILLSSANIGTLILSWSDSNPTLVGTPAVAGHTMWIHAGNFLTAADVTTPSILWQVSLQGGGDTPALYKGRVIAVDGFGFAKAYPAQCNNSCQPLWQADLLLAGGVGSPIVDGSKVYVWGASTGGTKSLVALDAMSGAVLFRDDLIDDFSYDPDRAPAVGEGLVFIHDVERSENILTFDSTTGDLVWEAAAVDYYYYGEDPAFWPIYSAGAHLVVHDSDDPYVSSLTAYPASCTTECPQAWSTNLDGARIDVSWSPALVGSTLYTMQWEDIVSHSVSLKGVDVATGQAVTDSRHFTCYSCAGVPGQLAAASDLVFAGTMPDPVDHQQIGLAVFQAGCDGDLCPYLFIGPSPYRAVGQIAVAGGRVFVPACPSDLAGNCTGNAEMKVYSTY